MQTYNKNNKFHLLIDKKFWKLIELGFKTYEYRKLIKGLISGRYFFFDATGDHKLLGSATLTTKYFNPYIDYNPNSDISTLSTGVDDDYIDSASAKWLSENYIKDGEEFNAYEIEGVISYD